MDIACGIFGIIIGFYLLGVVFKVLWIFLPNEKPAAPQARRATGAKDGYHD